MADDELGHVVRTGLDIDGSGSLDPGGNDRISDTDTLYASIAGQWWQQTTQRLYPYADDPTAVTAGIQRTQVSGLIADGERGESVAIDIHGNTTIRRTVIDRASSTQTQTTDYPDATIDARAISVNGRLMESRSKTGVVTTHGYDALGRMTGVTDARTGTTTTHYDDQGRVDYVQDAAGHRTTFGYDPLSGRKVRQTVALEKSKRQLKYTPLTGGLS